MATKLSSVVIYHEELPLIKLLDSSITWSCDIGKWKTFSCSKNKYSCLPICWCKQKCIYGKKHLKTERFCETFVMPALMQLRSMLSEPSCYAIVMFLYISYLKSLFGFLWSIIFFSVALKQNYQVVTEPKSSKVWFVGVFQSFCISFVTQFSLFLQQ